MGVETRQLIDLPQDKIQPLKEYSDVCEGLELRITNQRGKNGCK